MLKASRAKKKCVFLCEMIACLDFLLSESKHVYISGHPVRVGGSGAGNNFEMSPLLSHEMKDTVITLDYVSLKWVM